MGIKRNPNRRYTTMIHNRRPTDPYADLREEMTPEDYEAEWDIRDMAYFQELAAIDAETDIRISLEKEGLSEDEIDSYIDLGFSPIDF